MSLPQFKREDLRDHADPARIDRVWSRIEADLPAGADLEGASATTRHFASSGAVSGGRESRRLRATLLLAASLAAFGGGVLVGRSAPSTSTHTTPVAIPTQESFDAVLAAGSNTRTFSLPGGGAVTLRPGGTMEIGQVDGGVVSLRLVQGEATLETAGGGTVAVQAGEARVSTVGASTLSIRRDERAIDVSVSDGLVEVEAPDGRRTLRTGERATASTVIQTAVVESPIHHRDAPQRSPSEPPPLVAEDGAPAPLAAPLEVAPPATPSWFALYDSGKIDEASAQLPAGELSAAIERGRSARELMALDHLARSKGEKVLAMRALMRVAIEFPDDPMAKAAAVTLGNMHRTAGNHALAAQFDELAKNSQFAEDVACRRIDALDARDPGAEDAARDYLAKFPEGRCRSTAEDLLSDAEEEASKAREAQGDDDGDGEKTAEKKDEATPVAPSAPGAPPPSPPPAPPAAPGAPPAR
jgi:hypothetical protein